jgi:hypothetical protein
VDCPKVIVRLEGDALSEKFGCGFGSPLHDVNLNDPMRVLQLNVPSVWRYSVVNQNVQSSTGSTAIVL